MINLRLNKRWVVLLSTISLLLTFLYLLHSPPPALQEVKDRVKDRVTELAKNIPIPGRKNPNINLFKLQYEPRDSHPISFLISEADKRFQKHEDDISRTFQETVTKYRRKNERHPPPGFAEWYKFARKRDVHNIDDFEQIMGDLRPFWSIPAVKIRSEASHLSEQDRDINAIHIRSGKVVKTGISNWRLEGYTEMIQAFVDKLPDMDIPINAMDQPRVIVPWNGLQKSMAEEKQSRKEYPETINNFTQHMIGFRTWALDQDRRFRNQTGWMNATGKQFMKLAKTACPPDSYATGGEAIETAEQRWKILPGGFISNRNLSTNLCTMGLEIQELHGFMMASSAMRVTHKLVPIFGESKTSVNNDILIPAAMYWRHDKWGSYNVSHDLRWEEKKDIFYWFVS